MVQGEGAALEGETELDPEGVDQMSAAPGLAASGPELAEAASSITGGIARTRMGGEASAAAAGAGFLAEAPIADVSSGNLAAVGSPPFPIDCVVILAVKLMTEHPGPHCLGSHSLLEGKHSRGALSLCGQEGYQWRH